MNNKVSVICSVKNGEHTVQLTLESVLDQTFSNFELVIVDDGSTDNTVEIIESLQDKFKEIKFIKTSGIGRSQALNLAISQTTGEYIANIDADDLWHPDKLQIQVDILQKKQEIFLIGTESKIIFENEIPSWDKQLPTSSKIIEVDDRLLSTNLISHPSVLMRKKELLEICMYNEKISRLVDYDLWLRAYSEQYKMIVVKSELVAKRIHTNQSFENKKRVSYTWDATKLQLKFIIKLKKYKFVLIPIIKFILAQLPFRLRKKINEIIFS